MSDREIHQALSSGEIVIAPAPEGVKGASVDLRLGPDLWIYPAEPVLGVSIDPAAVNVRDHIRRYCQPVDISAVTSYEIPPNGFVLGETLERIEVPLHLAAWVEGKSSLARLGLMVHITAPKIDPGYQGNITLEMFNLGRFPLKLSYGMDICALMLQRLGRPASVRYQGRFQG